MSSCYCNKKGGASNDDVVPPTLTFQNEDNRNKRKIMEEDVVMKEVDPEMKKTKMVDGDVVTPEWQVAGVGDDQTRELQ